MKQLTKIQSAVFLLGGVLMVIGAGCFALDSFIQPCCFTPAGYSCWAPFCSP